MNILSPLDSADEVQRLAEAGATEFYCGLLDARWHDKYPVISVNRRPAGKGHFGSFKNLQGAVEEAHAHNIPVYFTLNEHYYIEQQYGLLSSYISGAVDAGIDAVIVADFGLASYIIEQQYPVDLHMGTGGTVFNSRSVAFYKDMGVVSITLPRHLTVAEIENIAETCPEVPLTVFILNSRCVHVDGFCTFQHGLSRKSVLPMYRNACMLPFHIGVHVDGNNTNMIMSHEQQSIMAARQKIWENVHVDDHPCGACGLYSFQKSGIASVKIVGRGNDTKRKITDVTYIRSLLDMIEQQGVDEDAFNKQAKELYAQTYNRQCREHMCYYPSRMFRPDDQ